MQAVKISATAREIVIFIGGLVVAGLIGTLINYMGDGFLEVFSLAKKDILPYIFISIFTTLLFLIIAIYLIKKHRNKSQFMQKYPVLLGWIAIIHNVSIHPNVCHLIGSSTRFILRYLNTKAFHENLDIELISLDDYYSNKVEEFIDRLLLLFGIKTMALSDKLQRQIYYLCDIEQNLSKLKIAMKRRRHNNVLVVITVNDASRLEKEKDLIKALSEIFSQESISSKNQIYFVCDTYISGFERFTRHTLTWCLDYKYFIRYLINATLNDFSIYFSHIKHEIELTKSNISLICNGNILHNWSKYEFNSLLNTYAFDTSFKATFINYRYNNDDPFEIINSILMHYYLESGCDFEVWDKILLSPKSIKINLSDVKISSNDDFLKILPHGLFVNIDNPSQLFFLPKTWIGRFEDIISALSNLDFITKISSHIIEFNEKFIIPENNQIKFTEEATLALKNKISQIVNRTNFYETATYWIDRDNYSSLTLPHFVSKAQQSRYVYFNHFLILEEIYWADKFAKCSSWFGGAGSFSTTDKYKLVELESECLVKNELEHSEILLLELCGIVCKNHNSEFEIEFCRTDIQIDDAVENTINALRLGFATIIDHIHRRANLGVDGFALQTAICKGNCIQVDKWIYQTKSSVIENNNSKIFFEYQQKGYMDVKSYCRDINCLSEYNRNNFSDINLQISYTLVSLYVKNNAMNIAQFPYLEFFWSIFQNSVNSRAMESGNCTYLFALKTIIDYYGFTERILAISEPLYILEELLIAYRLLNRQDDYNMLYEKIINIRIKSSNFDILPRLELLFGYCFVNNQAIRDKFRKEFEGWLLKRKEADERHKTNSPEERTFYQVYGAQLEYISCSLQLIDILESSGCVDKNEIDIGLSRIKEFNVKHSKYFAPHSLTEAFDIYLAHKLSTIEYK